jgi:hypothetical protein
MTTGFSQLVSHRSFSHGRSRCRNYQRYPVPRRPGYVCLDLCLICPRGTHFILSAMHFINNEQEHLRELASTNVDDRYIAIVSKLTPTNALFCKQSTQHEIYAAPFFKSVHTGVAAVLCSYSMSAICSPFSIELSCEPIDRVNGIYACEQPEILNGLLKGS